MQQPVRKDQLPDGAKVWMGEKGPFQTKPGGLSPLPIEGFRVIVFDVDGETGAFSVEAIVQAETIAWAVEHLVAGGLDPDSAWIPCDHTEPGSWFLQSDCLSLAEAVEAAIGLPVWRPEPENRCPHCGALTERGIT